MTLANKTFEHFLNTFTKINLQWDENAVKRGIFTQNHKNIYLHQFWQYSSVYCNNSGWQRELSKNAKFVCHAVTKTKNYPKLKSSIGEAHNFTSGT